MPTYVATNFVANEQPVTGKWNQLNGNDAFFYALLVGSGVLTSTVLTNPYKMGVYQSSSQSVPNGTFTKLSFQTKEYDTGSNFDATTNFRFTAPVAGFYSFSTAVGLYVIANTHVVLTLYKNGAEIKRLFEGTSQNSTVNNNFSGSTVLQLAANDYLEVWISQSQGSATSILATQVQTWFNGFFVSSN